MSDTRYWAGIVHEHRNQCEASVINALDKIDDAGWHPESLPMRNLWNDAKAFRELAAKVDAKLQELLKPQETNP